MKPVPISTAREIAKSVGADGLIIIAINSNSGLVGGTSYGGTRDKCQKLGRWLDRNTDGIGLDMFHAMHGQK